MPYAKEKKRILAGSLNLVAPGDLTPEPDSQELIGWRADTAGVLRSRKGMTAAASGMPAFIRSLFRVGDDRYAGVGEQLRYGGDLSSVLASGFDWAPLGFAAYQGLVFVMNRAKRVRVEGGEAHQWGIDAPTSAPIAAAGAVQSISVASFDQGEEWEITRWTSDTGAVVSPTATSIVANEGSVAATNGSNVLTGTGTAWTSELDGKNIWIDGPTHRVWTVVSRVIDETHMEIASSWDDSDGSGLQYAVIETVEAWGYDASNKIDGASSLFINCNPAAVWAASHPYPGGLDTRIDGLARDDDLFKVWFYAEDIESVSRLRLMFTDQASRVATAIIEPEAITMAGLESIVTNPSTPTRYIWYRLAVTRGSAPLAVLEGNPEYAALVRRIAELETLLNADADNAEALRGEYDNAVRQRVALFEQARARAPQFQASSSFDWGNIKSFSVEVQAVSPLFVHFDKAEFIGGKDGSLVGEWTWFVTFANDLMQESNPSPPSNTVALAKQSAVLTNIPVSPDPQVTRRMIYGIGGGLNEPLRFAVVNDNSSTSYTVTETLDEAQTNRNLMPIDHDPPPAARGVTGPYFGRLIAWSSEDHPARMWWTPVAKPYAWPGSDDDFEGNWIDVGDEREAILAATTHKRLLPLYKERSIWRLLGDPASNDPEPVDLAHGILGPCAVANAGDVDYFASADGIYRFNGDYAEEISQKIAPIFRGEFTKLADDVSVLPIDREHADTSSMAFAFGRVYFSYPEAGNNTPSATLVYDVQTERWYRDDRGFQALYYEGQGRPLLGASWDKLCQLDDGDTDAGAPIHVKWITGYLDQGLPDNPKVYSDLVFDFQSPSPLAVTLFLDNGDRIVQLGSIMSTERDRQVFSLGVDGTGLTALNAAVLIEGDITAEAILHGVYLHYYPLARAGKTYDSGVGDDGTELPKQYFEIELNIEATGLVNWALYTDMPGGVMAVRDSGSFPATARATLQIPLQSGVNIMGRHRRLVLWSDHDFQLHSGRLRLLPVGEYIDGARGDSWESQPVG